MATASRTITAYSTDDVVLQNRGSNAEQTFGAHSSVVFQRYADGWKVEHSHFSLYEGKTQA